MQDLRDVLGNHNCGCHYCGIRCQSKDEIRALVRNAIRLAMMEQVCQLYVYYAATIEGPCVTTAYSPSLRRRGLNDAARTSFHRFQLFGVQYLHVDAKPRRRVLTLLTAVFHGMINWQCSFQKLANGWLSVSSVHEVALKRGSVHTSRPFFHRWSERFSIPIYHLPAVPDTLMGS
jgi:hypothetical protein